MEDFDSNCYFVFFFFKIFDRVRIFKLYVFWFFDGVEFMWFFLLIVVFIFVLLNKFIFGVGGWCELGFCKFRLGENFFDLVGE